MFLNKKHWNLVFGALALAVFCALAYAPTRSALHHLRQQQELSSCTSAQANDHQIECIFGVLSSEIKAHGIASAMEVFSKAYEMFPVFVSGGCHQQAHRVGDLAYYNLYVGAEDITAIDFPQSTTACGYGFYHGFLEHLIQDHPSPDFVDKTCTYLTDRLGATMGDMRLTCYHGSGHGFVLAQIEKTKHADWGVVRKFSDIPAKLCGELKLASDVDKEQCLEGIFNVIVDSMSINQYGFTYNYAHPFVECDRLPSLQQRACYYEMAQKLDKPSGNDPVKLAALASQAITPEYKLLSFQVGIAGVIQQVIGNGDEYKQVLEKCGALSDDLYSACLGSVINGLYEHGDPQKEYEKALGACVDPSVAAHGAEELCYNTIAVRMPRFYTDEKIAAICPVFPDRYRALCETQIGERSGDQSVSLKSGQ